MTADVVAYVGLGSNLQKPAAQLAEALDVIGRHNRISVLACSSFYASAPVGDAYQGQPDYVNAVIKLATDLGPVELLQILLDIERHFGRSRDVPNASRTLDLDLLLYGTMQLDEPGLQVPHPRMHERAFVLEPLFEIEPALEIPNKGAVAVLRTSCRNQSLTLLETA